MTIQDNKVVSLSYELEVDDEMTGKRMLADKSEEGHPLVFIFGNGQLLERFEDNIREMKAGDTFAFSIPPDEGYGDYDDDSVVSLPLEVFRVNGELDMAMLQPGNMLPMADQDGNPMQGRVVEVTEREVLMDFNHPLAGLELHFKGQVLNVREATEIELSHGHVHGEGGVEHD
jgi:FKBP-type peptidyl-prolyl cis-trans isomerase SlyD